MRRVLWVAWALSAMLGFSSPWMRTITGRPGFGRWPIFGAVLIMLLTLAMIRRLRDPIGAAVTMSASAIAVGGSAGFLTLAFASGRTVSYFLAAKWGLAGLVLLLMFLRRMRMEERR